MPLYEYRCRDCGRRFEVLQQMGEGGEGLECPECGAAAAERQFSTFSSAGGSGPRADAGCGAGGFT